MRAVPGMPVYDIAIPLTQPLFGHTYRRLSDLDPATIGLLRDLREGLAKRSPSEHR